MPIFNEIGKILFLEDFFSFQGMRFFRIFKTSVRFKIYTPKLNTLQIFHWYFSHLRTYLRSWERLKIRKVTWDTNSTSQKFLSILGTFWFLPSNSSLSKFFIEIKNFELSDNFCGRGLLLKVLRGYNKRL